jgi:hypothetical protein
VTEIVQRVDLVDDERLRERGVVVDEDRQPQRLRGRRRSRGTRLYPHRRRVSDPRRAPTGER